MRAGATREGAERKRMRERERESWRGQENRASHSIFSTVTQKAFSSRGPVNRFAGLIYPHFEPRGGGGGGGVVGGEW